MTLSSTNRVHDKSNISKSGQEDTMCNIDENEIRVQYLIKMGRRILAHDILETCWLIKLNNESQERQYIFMHIRIF